MTYCYQTEKAIVFTDKGQRAFLAVRDAAHRHLAQAGAVMAGRLLSATGGEIGDSWAQMALVDRLVELQELSELTSPVSFPAWQHRVFIAGPRSPDVAR